MVDYCQSCGMPLTHSEDRGTEKDGTGSKDYCRYCYMNGEFLYDCTMDEMIEKCLPFMIQNNPEMSEDQALKMMRDYMPKLKRWKGQ